MSVSHVSFRHPGHLISTLVEGAVGGLLAGLAVMTVFFAYDLGFAEAFRTPTVLNAYLWGGAEAARSASATADAALAFSVVHFSAWLVVGVLAAFAVSATERSRWVWYAVTISATTLLFALITLGAFWEIPGLGGDVLWVGALVGGFVLLLYLGWRHPRLIEPTI